MATVYCSSCGAPYADIRGKCPNCGTVEPEALTNTLAPAGDAGDEEAVQLARRFGREEASASERECPKCAETIKAKAKVCRFCGYNLRAHDDRLVDDGDDDDDDGEDDRPARRGKKRRPSERIPRRALSPMSCPCGGFRVTRTPIWAIVCCVIFFPLGLVLLFVKETKCVRCGM